MTTTESPHSLTVKALNRAGFDCMFTVRADDAGEFFTKANKLLEWLPKAGFTPTEQRPRRSQPNGPAPQAAATAPVCQWHGPMKPSTKAPGTYYCPAKMADGSYCKTKTDATGNVTTPPPAPMTQHAVITHAANGNAPAPLFDNQPPPPGWDSYYDPENN